MKKFKNGPLTGRGDVPLVINTPDGDSTGMTVAGMHETAAYYKANKRAQEEVVSLQDMRKLNKVLDAVEGAGCCLAIEDDQYELVSDAIEEIVTRSWPIHAPSVIDQMEGYENDTDSCDNCDCGD